MFTFSSFMVPLQQQVFADTLVGQVRPQCCTHLAACDSKPTPEAFRMLGSSMGVLGVASFGVLTGKVAHAKKRVFRRCGNKLAGGAAAIQPGADFDMTNQYGVTSPCGEPGVSFWDPAGLSKNIDRDTFRQYRAAELKHGRICMLAVFGLIVQHFSKWPKLEDVPSGIGAATSDNPAAPILGLIFMLAGIIEYNTNDDDREPGDFGDPFEFIEFAEYNPNRADDVTLWRNRELNHCRLAMVGFLGVVAAESATGFDVIEQWKFAGAAWKRTITILSFPDSTVLPLQYFN